MFEQAENLENPLRCPVKLYEFYLSKWLAALQYSLLFTRQPGQICYFLTCVITRCSPESIKNRSDVFDLVPERSCVPDSPVWYSTQNLGGEHMSKMLNRLRVVKEIQEAQLHMQPFGSY